MNFYALRIAKLSLLMTKYEYQGISFSLASRYFVLSTGVILGISPQKVIFTKEILVNVTTQKPMAKGKKTLSDGKRLSIELNAVKDGIHPGLKGKMNFLKIYLLSQTTNTQTKKDKKQI